MEGAGERFEHSGRYVVIERPQRLVFTWISAGTDHRLSLVTLVFTPSSGGVRIDLEHEGIPDAERALRQERGWGSILGKLAALQHGTDRSEVPAMPEATMHDIRFPNESPQYRAARDRLPAAEMALRRQIEAVAAERRALPPGGRVAEDYVFEEGDGARRVKMSELFGDKSVLQLYSYMYGPAMAAPCPSCTSILDGLDGQVRHIEQRAAVAAVARSPIARLRAIAQQRGWRRLRLLSSSGNSYHRDYRGEDAEGNQRPILNAFVRAADGSIPSRLCHRADVCTDGTRPELAPCRRDLVAVGHALFLARRPRPRHAAEAQLRLRRLQNAAEARLRLK